MSKELGALRMLEQVCLVANIANMEEQINIIEKALKALEIIKEKWVQVGAFIEMHNDKKIIEIAKKYRGNYFLFLYNCCFANLYGELTQEEFDLLKEVLL